MSIDTVFWCDDLDAPTMGIADINWWNQQSHSIIRWLEERGGHADLNGGIIFVPDIETRTLFTLRWL